MRVRQMPMGVVALVTAWNFTLILVMRCPSAGFRADA